jgi:hypothetical protein
MDATQIRIAKRVTHYMLEVANEQIDMNFFMGLGFSLGIIYEEVTGKTCASLKPQELMQWALGLPEVPFPKVSD